MQYNKHSVPKVTALLAMMACSLSTHAAEPVRIQVPAQYEENAPVVDQVRRECAVESLLGNHVLGKVHVKYPDALAVADPLQMQQGRVLKLTILSVQGVGGGGWSGAKAVTARGDLLQDGQVVRSTVLREHSRGGVLGGMRGTCSILEIVTESLGRQFAVWLARMDGVMPVAATATTATTATTVTTAAAPAAAAEPAQATVGEPAKSEP